MKNKLWVYGCSYSDVWGDNTLEDSWFGIVADDLNLSCIGWDEDKEGRSRYSIAGSGWLETQQAILNIKGLESTRYYNHRRTPKS